MAYVFFYLTVYGIYYPYMESCIYLTEKGIIFMVNSAVYYLTMNHSEEISHLLSALKYRICFNTFPYIYIYICIYIYIHSLCIILTHTVHFHSVNTLEQQINTSVNIVMKKPSVVGRCTFILPLICIQCSIMHFNTICVRTEILRSKPHILWQFQASLSLYFVS